MTPKSDQQSYELPKALLRECMCGIDIEMLECLSDLSEG